ncbi:phosphoribosyl-ATP diphosphatase [Maliponia aquimaris]|uniref:Phosphoribosyl-ATP pyrophosphatase n=1 Tax=Maliponia aquimaris TaxID=1673631 RepID=A0A238L430_9RHOB|nr:phosphoribosyl-ATP diphosphatase [Maliponia aquimaris]SMX49581.1 Phosphoribosyl-ATP pyrophosphatase [Maliponia aquimaris]
MTLEELETIVAARAAASPDESWTAKLLAKGPEKAAEKFGEEAIEAIIEAVKNDREKLVSEVADVLFHLLVMLRSREVTVAEVMAELDRRTASSGLAEKAGRTAE